MRIMECRDRMDWWLTRSNVLRRLPLALLILLALAAVVGFGVILRAGREAPLMSGGPILSVVAPPGGVQQQATPAPSVVSLPLGEMTVIKPAQTTAPQITETELRGYERAIADEVNKRRAENGVKALVWDDAVAAVARAHSEDMALRNYFEHTTPEGNGVAQRFPGRATAENIIFEEGKRFIATELVDSWMSSPGHRANILRVSMRRTGVGVAVSKAGAIYVTQDFT